MDDDKPWGLGGVLPTQTYPHLSLFRREFKGQRIRAHVNSWWFWPPKAHSSSQPISPRLKKWPFIKIYHQNPYIYYHPDRYLTPPTKSESWKLQQLRNKKSVLEVPPHPRPHSTRIPSRRNEGQKRASGKARNGENALKPIHFTLKCIKPRGHLPSVCQLLVWLAGYNDITIYMYIYI